MARGPITRTGAVAALCGALSLVGCSGQRDTAEGRKVEAAVKRFALARGPEACAMLTHHALRHVYGGLHDDFQLGRKRCLAESAKFAGEPVVVTFVQFRGPRSAHASARTLDRRRFYVVGLIKPRGRWEIQSVTAKPRVG
jgi:hypothetical protein